MHRSYKLDYVRSSLPSSTETESKLMASSVNKFVDGSLGILLVDILILLYRISTQTSCRFSFPRWSIHGHIWITQRGQVNVKTAGVKKNLIRKKCNDFEWCITWCMCLLRKWRRSKCFKVASIFLNGTLHFVIRRSMHFLILYEKSKIIK